MSWAARWVAALRWPTVAAALRLNVRVRPVATARQSADGPVVLSLTVLTGSCVQDVVESSDKLRAFYKCARIEVVPDRVRGDRVAVVVHTSLVPGSSPYPLTTVPSGRFLPRPVTEPLPLGLDAQGRLVSIPLFDSVSGGTSLLVGGVPGTGKTNTLRVLLAGLAETTATLLVIDPTGGAEAALWSNRVSAVVSSAEPAPTIALLNEVLTIIHRRGRILGAGGSTNMLPPVVLVCDELAELAAAGTAKQQDEARALLRRIVALGRKANISTLLATQRTTATSIDVTTRSLAAWRIALPHPDDPHGSEALLGPGHRQAAALRKSDVGVGFLTDGGPAELLRVFTVHRSDVPALSLMGRGRELCELAAIEEAALRELMM